ncbi:ribbon-helix-helix protein, CopG family [Aetokthonos hydrillicola Thurmond2011]|uniref:Ribbon-helix-helix protein, CopG family n=1 Tax=Aetokthonos hydrillicola Thurmond2011 TaxID=2712845 RepID=A0AAP5IHT6_9CYAN|nr:ribbon-helix-helix protein, CopG family [Aetokthonos hydrillicola]MBW4591294.1 ribbon-helix-helix protein, CopG family [Aetokthonos hydrillicola CCALA 1050]MDR9900508.1 ribbon-helix-helix protein, CopG family [Aetokthonos hydrillicola Thurmond2011]
MASPQFSVRLPQELDERLSAYVKQAGITKTKVMLDALAHYLGCANDVPLIHRVIEMEERLTALEAEVRGK